MIRNLKSLTSAPLTHFDQAQQTIPEDSLESPIADLTIAVLEPSTCGSTLTLAKVGDSTARGMGWMSLASLQKGAVLLSIPQGRRNGIHAERREWNTCNEPERSKSNQKALTFGIECAGDKCQSKCTEEALRYLSSLNIKSFRSAKEKEKGWKSSASRQANDGFEPLTAKASRSKPPLSTKNRYNEKLYKAFCKDSDLPSDMRDKLRYKLSKLPRNSSFARVRNRCISTGRPRSVYEFFRISRIVFRGLASRAGPANPPLGVVPYPYLPDEHRLLDHNTTPSAPEIELARYQAEDLLRSRKVDIIHQMAGLDPTGDWMGKGARALDRLSHYQGANSFRTQLTASIDKAERPWLSIIAHRASALLQRFANPKRLAMRIQLR
ncbi:hypothetical protein HN51_059290 [Arachis hypogaea]